MISAVVVGGTALDWRTRPALGTPARHRIVHLVDRTASCSRWGITLSATGGQWRDHRGRRVPHILASRYAARRNVRGLEGTITKPYPARALAKHVHCDVLIVGSGPSGVVFAKRAAERKFKWFVWSKAIGLNYRMAISRRLGFELTAPRDWQCSPLKRDISGD